MFFYLTGREVPIVSFTSFKFYLLLSLAHSFLWFHLQIYYMQALNILNSVTESVLLIFIFCFMSKYDIENHTNFEVVTQNLLLIYILKFTSRYTTWKFKQVLRFYYFKTFFIFVFDFTSRYAPKVSFKSFNCFI